MTGTANNNSSSVTGTPVRASIISISAWTAVSSSSMLSSFGSFGVKILGALGAGFLLLSDESLFFLFFLVSLAVPEDY